MGLSSVKQLVAGLSPRGHESILRQPTWYLWWTKRHRCWSTLLYFTFSVPPLMPHAHSHIYCRWYTIFAE